jgi:flagellin-like hook-associated protein FlgL
MASSNITLSSAVRQNLLSLQSTAAMMSLTQNRLATGKKVNSALDNPSNFFTSQTLSNRASDLNALLDSVGQAQQTLKAADAGLSSLTKLVESAKSVAKQAQQAPKADPSSYTGITVTGTLGAESLGTHDGAAVTVADSTTYSFDIEINGGSAVTATFTSGVGATWADISAGLVADFNTKVGAAAGSTIELVAGAAATDGFTVNALTLDTDFTIDNNTGAGLTDADYDSTSLLDNIVTAGGADGDTLSLTVNGAASPTVITFGAGTGEVSTIAELNTALGTRGTATGTTLTLSVAATTNGTATTLAAASSTAGLATALGINQAVSEAGTETVGAPNATRTSLESDFNAILQQIDQLAADASYNGVNLLDGDDFKVVFNENGTSSLNIEGVSFDMAGLGLNTVTAGGFQDAASIDVEIAKLDGALSSLRNQASKFGSNLSTVQTRQDFTKNMINTLQTGADNLVLADTNEEGANLLALQTRQQLSSTALSLSAQADQAVLRLF